MNFNEMKESIKNISIEDFCNTNGIELLGNGKFKRLKLHDSCVINVYENNFYWNSRRTNGDIINFVESYYQVDFKSAIQIISGKDISEISKSEYIPKQIKSNPTKKKPEFKMNLDETDKKYSRLYAYLNKSRKISYKTISEFVNKKLISQDNMGNINFKFTDEKGKIHFSKKGTTDKPFTYIDTDSDIRGFRYIPNETDINQIDTLYLFEAAIDLMSYVDIYDLSKEKSVLVSMNGVKHNSLIENLKDFPNLKKIFLCVDNDIAGQLFVEAIIEMKTDIEELKGKSISRIMPSESYKDWNEMLQSLNDKNIIKKLEDIKKESENSYKPKENLNFER